MLAEIGGTLLQILYDGGWMMWVIMPLTLLALVVFAERSIVLGRVRFAARRSRRVLEKALKDDRLTRPDGADDVSDVGGSDGGRDRRVGEPGPAASGRCKQMTLLALILALSAQEAPATTLSPDTQSPDSGSICVAPLPVGEGKLDLDSLDGTTAREAGYQFNVQIDRAEPVDLPGEKPLLVARLELSKTHQVIIRDDETPVASFRFTFEKRGRHLCLSYIPGYKSWHLDPPQPGWPECRCEGL